MGTGAEKAVYDATLPIAFRQAEGEATVRGTFRTPTIANSELPGLLGLAALRKSRALLDLNTLKMHFMGPGDYELERHLPAGSQSFQCELAPSGHMVISCCEFTRSQPRQEDSTVTLHTRAASEPPNVGRREEHPRSSIGMTPIRWQ